MLCHKFFQPRMPHDNVTYKRIIFLVNKIDAETILLIRGESICHIRQSKCNMMNFSHLKLTIQFRPNIHPYCKRSFETLDTTKVLALVCPDSQKNVKDVRPKGRVSPQTVKDGFRHLWFCKGRVARLIWQGRSWPTG